MILVTGATGMLASAIVDQLQQMNSPVVGASRTPANDQRHMDFDEPATLSLTGVSTLVLVSAGYAEDDVVIARHKALISAAVRDRVSHIVYTSVTGAGDHLGFALAHRVTERMLRESGIQWTILRNGIYAELFGALLAWTAGGLESPFGDGAISSVARADLAEVAARVASSPDNHRQRIYELVGKPLTAATVASHVGVTHQSIGLGEYRDRVLNDRRLLPFQPPMLASIASSIRHGLLHNSSTDLERLLGRPATNSLAIAARTANTSRS
ncbi:NAD(P)H-binding protein [Glutamicibacter endophyticus]|uniref:NAD(P)H-binding protein n=1 Tax=Glutamicibacter endophyticus TaxID=1522174 RepID=UPI003AF0D0BF